jgi:hypothetical protein
MRGSPRTNDSVPNHLNDHAVTLPPVLGVERISLVMSFSWKLGMCDNGERQASTTAKRTAVSTTTSIYSLLNHTLRFVTFFIRCAATVCSFPGKLPKQFNQGSSYLCTFTGLRAVDTVQEDSVIFRYIIAR